jgi:hypothetical protein
MLIIKKNISVTFLHDPPKAFINFLSSDNRSVYAKIQPKKLNGKPSSEFIY